MKTSLNFLRTIYFLYYFSHAGQATTGGEPNVPGFLLINSQAGHVLKRGPLRPHVHSSWGFIFSVWPNDNPTGRQGHGGLRLEGKQNTYRLLRPSG